MKRRMIPVVALATVLASSGSLAQDASLWIGKRVVTRQKAVLKVGDQVVDEGKTHRVYMVEQVNGRWLWLVSGPVAGWVSADQVVPFDEALDYFSRYTYTEAAAWAYAMKGIIWMDKKQPDLAISHFNESLGFSPNQAWVWNSRGNAWTAKGDYHKALADYNKAIQLDPKFASAFYNRGNAWRDKGEYERAIADYDEAIRLDPRYAPALYGRGAARLYKKEYDKAIADFNEAVRLDPNYAPAFIGRAWIWAACPEDRYRDGRRAVESAYRACELTAWSDALYLANLAAAYAESGDFDKAVEHQEKAIRLAAGDKAKKDYESRLALFKNKRPYRGD